jgi:hypothetical protein
MMCEVLKFDDKFDASGMTMMDMKREIHRRGWYAGRLDTQRLIFGDGKAIVRRISRAEADNWKGDKR